MNLCIGLSVRAVPKRRQVINIYFSLRTNIILISIENSHFKLILKIPSLSKRQRFSTSKEASGATSLLQVQQRCSGWDTLPDLRNSQANETLCN